MTRFENVGIFTPTFSNLVILQTERDDVSEHTVCSIFIGG